MNLNNLKAIDIHCHLNFPIYDKDRDDVIGRSLDDDVWMVNIGTQRDTSGSAVRLANKYDKGVYATIGLHPIHGGGSTYHDKNELSEDEHRKNKGEWDYEFYKDLAQKEKVVAIGECGLDYFRCDKSVKPKQKKVFEEQIHLANELNKPLMLHIRDAYSDAAEILKSESRVSGVAHFFSGSWEKAKKFLDLGYFISFAGPITFATEYNEVVKNVPMDMILADTDSPYASPVPYRGKRNEPLYVKEIIKQIAGIKGEKYENVRVQLIRNAFRALSFPK